MKDKKIIFMGTPDIAAQHLNILIENNLNVVGVFTQPPRKKNRGMRVEKSDVHQIADKNNINIFYPTTIDDIKTTVTCKIEETKTRPLTQQNKTEAANWTKT